MSNYSLSKTDLKLSISLQNISTKDKERGGSCTDWLEILSTGPGMQARSQNIATDFFSPISAQFKKDENKKDENKNNDWLCSPFIRRDEDDDSIFYETDRMVNHVDSMASKIICNIYKNYIDLEIN